MSALSNLLQEANASGYSAREIARRAGDRVHHSTLSRYLKGEHGVAREDVLQVFADVLQVSMPRLREAAGTPMGEQDPYVPPAEANRLNSRQRAALNELIRAMTAAEDGDGRGQQSAPTSNVTRLPTAGDVEDTRVPDDVAAWAPGQKSTVQQARDQQDQDADER